MKLRLLASVCFALCAGLLSADDTFGAFRIDTSPQGADITLYDTDQYLCTSPSPVFPVVMDDYMEYRDGIPGREITLIISKEGYIPLKKDIYVPLNNTDQEEAIYYPTVYSFHLERDLYSLYVRYLQMYSYNSYYDNPNPNHHHNGSYHPWQPEHPYGYGYTTDNPPYNPPGGGHHGNGDHHGGNNPPSPPDNPPGGGNGGGGHHGGNGGGGNPPPPPPGGGSGGGNGGGGTPPPPPGGGNGGGTNPPPPPPPGGGTTPPNPPTDDEHLTKPPANTVKPPTTAPVYDPTKKIEKPPQY